MKNKILYSLFGTTALFVASCVSTSKELTFKNPADDADVLKAQKSEIFVPYQQLTKEPGAHWFAYYDKNETDPTGRYVLAMRTMFEDRMPEPTDTVEIGMVDTKDNCKWIKLGTSSSWGWQQGCQLQFLPGTESEVIWNDRENGKFVSRIMDIKTKKMRTIPMPVYAVSPDGKWAVTVDYGRVNDMRPGYGYSGIADKYADQKYPSEAGIWKVDLTTGESKLIVSHADAMKIANPHDPEFTDAKHWFNHLLVSPDGKRFIFVHRWQYADDRAKKYRRVGGFGTRMFTASADGKDLRVIDPYNYTSHFIWTPDSKSVVAWTKIPHIKNGNKGLGFFDIADTKEENIKQVGKGVMLVNGHNTFLGNNPEWILNDTYPQGKDRQQTIYLYNTKTNKRYDIAKLHMPLQMFKPLRCDTHPRSTPDGKKVIVDSSHSGTRQIYIFDVSEIVK